MEIIPIPAEVTPHTVGSCFLPSLLINVRQRVEVNRLPEWFQVIRPSRVGGRFDRLLYFVCLDLQFGSLLHLAGPCAIPIHLVLHAIPWWRWIYHLTALLFFGGDLCRTVLHSTFCSEWLRIIAIRRGPEAVALNLPRTVLTSRDEGFPASSPQLASIGMPTPSLTSRVATKVHRGS